MSEELSWTPVRKGEIYCSPACGCGCTQAAFELATLRGERLAARLNEIKGGFNDWSFRVWENMGWHYEALRVLPAEAEKADTWCSMAEYWDREGEPRGYWCDSRIAGYQIHADGNTPEAALKAVMDQMVAMRDAVILSFKNFKAV